MDDAREANDPPVSLRPTRSEDLPTLFEHQRDPESNAMAAFPPRDREAFDAHWARLLADPTVVSRTILLGTEIAGSIGSWEQDGRRLVGYWIGRSYWGRGIATRALAAFLDEARERPLLAYVAKHNRGSIRVLEKCGFTRCAEPLPPAADGVEEYLYRIIA
jgi:RimJ/RimL family protein N-acetyltransferase